MTTNLLFIILTIAIHSSVAFCTTPITTGFLQVNLEGDTLPEDIVVPPFTLLGSMVDDEIINNIEVKHTGIPQKGYGAFAKGTIPRHSFLGFYLGPRFQNESLDDKMKERAEQITQMGEEGKYIYPMDYAISLDGGANWIDGFDRALDRSYYEPVFMNHADGGTDRCTVIRILEEDRMAFFARRDIIEGEELAFDYGEEFWKGREDMKF